MSLYPPLNFSAFQLYIHIPCLSPSRLTLCTHSKGSSEALICWVFSDLLFIERGHAPLFIQKHSCWKVFQDLYYVTWLACLESKSRVEQDLLAFTHSAYERVIQNLNVPGTIIYSVPIFMVSVKHFICICRALPNATAFAKLTHSAA